jgi:hypothetical protein
MFATASTDPFSPLFGWGIILFGCYLLWKKFKKASKNKPDTPPFPPAQGGRGGHDFHGVPPTGGGGGDRPEETGYGSEGYQVSPVRKGFPMKRALIQFPCEKCREPLEIGMNKGGTLSTCPECDSVIRVPRRSHSPAAGADSDDPTVPVSMTLPGGGGFQTNMSRSDATKMGFTVLGALLAIVCVLFGIKWNGRA